MGEFVGNFTLTGGASSVIGQSSFEALVANLGDYNATVVTDSASTHTRTYDLGASGTITVTINLNGQGFPSTMVLSGTALPASVPTTKTYNYSGGNNAPTYTYS